MASRSPTKAQWAVEQPSRRDQSPSGAQWNASVTLRAIQSESLKIRGSTSAQKYVPSPTASSFQRTTHSSSDTGKRSTMQSSSSSFTTLNTAHSSMSGFVDPISPKTVVPPMFIERSTSRRGRNDINHFPMPIDTVKAQQGNALGVYRSDHDISPTSTSFGDYHYWQGGNSPHLLRGSEPPLANAGPSWSSSHSPSSTPRQAKTPKVVNKPNDPVAVIEEEARALLQARYQGFPNVKPSPKTVRPLQISPKLESKPIQNKEVVEYAGHPVPILSNDLPKKVRINTDQPSLDKHSPNSNSSSRTSLFRKAFKNNSPSKQVESKSSDNVRDLDFQSMNVATRRSIMRHTHSTSNLTGQQLSRPGTLSRMISAPILMETSSPASPAIRSSRKLSIVSTNSTHERMEVSQQIRQQVNQFENPTEQPKRRQRAPPPPPPPRRKQSSNTVSSREPVSPFSTSSSISPPSPPSPFTPPEHIPVEFGREHLKGKDSLKIPESTIFSNTVQNSYDLVSEVGGERKGSNSDSIPSNYDQDSWQDHSPTTTNVSQLTREKYLEEQDSDTSSFDEHIPMIICAQDRENDQRLADESLQTQEYVDADETALVEGRRYSIPKHYKIVRTSDDDSKDLEYLDSIILYENESEEEGDDVLETSSDSQTPFINKAQDEDFKPRSARVRESGFFELDAMAQHTQPTRKRWSDKETGKLNALGLIMTTASSTMAYISPFQFKEIYGISNDALTDQQSNQNFDEYFKGNRQRLLLTAAPMYERLFTRLWQVSHWKNRMNSFTWCTLYFTLWYFNALIPGLLTIVIGKIFNGRKFRKSSQDRQSVESLSPSGLIGKDRHLRNNSTSSNSTSLNSSPTLTGNDDQIMDKQEDQEATEALRKYEQFIAKFTAKTADVHERVQNMSHWARKPATVRTIIILSLMVFSSFFLNANDVIRLSGLFFGLFFFFFNPFVNLIQAFQRFRNKNNNDMNRQSKDTFNLIDFFLAGVPNDAEKEILINKRRQLQEKEEKKQEEKKVKKNNNKNIVIQPNHARAKKHEIEEQQSTKLTWADKGTSFKATFGEEEDSSQTGLLRISSESLIFVTDPPSFDCLLNIPLRQIIQLDKVRKVNFEEHQNKRKSMMQNEGLRIVIRDASSSSSSKKKTVVHTFLNMNLRDEAFDRILYAVPHQWRKQSHSNPN